MLPGQLALIDASLFTGAALYVSAVEHPAHLKLDDKNLLTAFQGAYSRAAKIQPFLAVTGTALGAYQYYNSKDPLWLAGAGLLIANIPYTLIVLMKTNNQLMATPSEKAGTDTRRMIENWGPLHSLRTVLGFAAVGVFAYAAMKSHKGFLEGLKMSLFPGHLALVESSLFSGTALCIGWQNSGHMKLDDKTLLQVFKQTASTSRLLPFLAGGGTILGVAQFTRSKDPYWVIGAGLLFLNIPYTIWAMVETENELVHATIAGLHTRKKTEKWGNLHMARTALGVGAIAAFLYAAYRSDLSYLEGVLIPKSV